MDSNPLIDLTWNAVAVALAGAVLWSLPIDDARWQKARNAIGWVLVTLGAAAYAVAEGSLSAFAEGAVSCVSGLGASWLLVELGHGAAAVARKIRRTDATMAALLLAMAVALTACGPSLGQVQDSLAGYHVTADAQGAATVVANTRMVAISGAAGSRVALTAPVLPDGSRGVVVERSLDRDGALAWRVILRERDGEQWLRLERVTCSAARAELAELPPCQPEPKSPAPDVVERRVYLH